MEMYIRRMFYGAVLALTGGRSQQTSIKLGFSQETSMRIQWPNLVWREFQQNFVLRRERRRD